MRPQTLEDFVGNVRSSGGQLVYEFCPVCGGGGYKTYVNPESGLWIDFRGGCKGKVDVGGEADANEEGRAMMWQLQGGNRREEWSEVTLPSFEPLSKRALRYLDNRGIDEEFARGMGIVEWSERFRILWPYLDDQGRQIYWNSRAYSLNLAEGPKYMAAPGRHPLYVPRRPDHPSKVVIVEGAFDAWAVNIVDQDALAVALGGKTLPRYLRRDLRKLLNGATLSVPPVIALDPDALPEAMAFRDRWGGKIADLPMDPADLLLEDPGWLWEEINA